LKSPSSDFTERKFLYRGGRSGMRESAGVSVNARELIFNSFFCFARSMMFPKHWFLLLSAIQMWGHEINKGYPMAERKVGSGETYREDRIARTYRGERQLRSTWNGIICLREAHLRSLSGGK